MTHTKDEALDNALEALIHKANMIPVMQGNCYVIHPEAMQAVIDEAIKQALATPVQEPDWSHAWLLIKAASYASSQGHISGTTNWGAAMSAYLRHETKATAQPAPVPLTDEKYNELLFAVNRKYPGESRHETVLRYIRKAEEPSSVAGSATAKGQP